MSYEPDKSHWGWTWLERWMAAKPWENRSKETVTKDFESHSLRSYSEMEVRRAMENVGHVQVRRNKVSTRIVPPRVCMYSGPLSSTSQHGGLQTTPRSRALGTEAPDASSHSSSSRSNTPTARGPTTSGLSHTYSTSSNSTVHYVSHGAPQVPGYMGTTQSAMAKMRAPLKVKSSFDETNLKRSCVISECEGSLWNG